MQQNHFLKSLEAVLDKFGYPCVFHQASEDTPFEHLNIKLPPDSQDRERFCILKVEEAALSLSEEEEPESFVQIYIPLPFSIEDQAMGEVSRTVNFFNKSLLMPGFVLDEMSKNVFFRYAFLKPGSTLSDSTFMALMGTILLWLDAFSDPIEEVAKGKTLAEVVQIRIDEFSQPS